MLRCNVLDRSYQDVAVQPVRRTDPYEAGESAVIRVLVIAPADMLSMLLRQVVDEADGFTITDVLSDPYEAGPQSATADIVLLHTASLGRDVRRSIQQVKEIAPAARIVMLSVPDLNHILLSYLEAGAAGYVRADQTVDEMLDTLRTIHEFGAYVDAGLVSYLVDQVSTLREQVTASMPHSTELPEELTRREWAVLELISADLSNSEIADRLFITVGTVKNHVHSILTKLEVENRAQAAYWYYWRNNHRLPGTDTGSRL